MKNQINTCLHFGRQVFFAMLLFLSTGLFQQAEAHQAPTAIVLLDVSPGQVAVELQLPLTELELAFGHDLTKSPETVIGNFGPQIAEYLKAHVHAYATKSNPWLVNIGVMQMDRGEQEASGPPYWELVVHLTLIPQAGETTRNFFLDYDVIMHQVGNHMAFVSIRNDWETGHTGQEPAQLGVIAWNLKDNVIYPLAVNLEKGSWYKGLGNMILLGMRHIQEGTDHLLFLLVLLLPATLVSQRKKWGPFAGVKPSIMRLLTIITAFTVGHSITLLIGALGWFRLPTQPVEVLIAVSILVSAIHAVKPIFAGKEMYIAAGFGLIHGLAFASALAELHLGAGTMAVSILGFNLGIELMQLMVIAFTVPWLIVLSPSPVYKWVRIIGAAGSGIAAIAWIAERTTGESNLVSETVQRFAPQAYWLVAFLAVLAMSVASLTRKSGKQAVG
jgi:hypothetical protein